MTNYVLIYDSKRGAYLSVSFDLILIVGFKYLLYALL